MSTDDTSTTTQGMDRRKFLTVLGVAGGGTVALSGCSTDRIEKLVPYLVQDEDQVPGTATTYASTCTECPAGCGVHVKTREARAIKLEGNPSHPVNRGSLCARGQAALQGLYNPGRLKGPLARNPDGTFSPVSWDDAIRRLAAEVTRAGAGTAVLSGAGPGTFTDLLSEWTRALGARLARYEPFDHEPQRAANRQVFGTDVLPAHDFARANYVLGFGADFLETWLSPVENQRGFAEAHGYHDGEMAKFVSLAPRMSLTGMNADEWHPTAPGSEALVALAMANVILSERFGAPADANALRGMLAAYTPDRAAQESGIGADTIRRLAREFASADPGLAVAGGVGNQHRGAIEACAAVNLLNYIAGNIGQTVHFQQALGTADGYLGVESLGAAMDTGQVSLLVVHEANPVYTLPQSSGFRDKMAKVAFKVSTASMLDETAALSDLVLPNHHALERWDDLRSRVGVHSLLQPVMQPVFDTRPSGDVLLQVAQAVGGALAGFSAPSFEVFLKDAWRTLAESRGSADAEQFWVDALGAGGVFDPPPAAEPVSLAPGASQIAHSAPTFDGAGQLVFVAYPSPMLFDGRGANKPWLLENPDPVTKITWQSWIELHPETAAALDVREGEIVRVTSPHGSIEAPAYLYAGLNPGVVAMPLGQGHTDYGEYAKGRGVNALDLLGPGEGQGFLPYLSTRVQVEPTGQYRKVAKTEGNPRQLGRGIAEAMPLDSARRGLSVEEAHYAETGGEHHEVNTERELEAIAGFRDSQEQKASKGDYEGEHPRWGMVIDLARCTGCSACVTACYAENNIPTVGEQEVQRGREMSWMRIERFFEGGEEPGEPLEARFVPMLCQQCGNAPCEPVCPVYASYHTTDGLNGQAYNRCVGTRYCGNNCPYKVRYYNWFAYNESSFPDPLHLQLNPDVTVRARGVMEKCTFCVQRIRGAQNEASLEDRDVADGDVVPACGQACPSEAIVFGDLNDPASRVSAAARNQRGYHVFEDLNVRPSVMYLAKVRHEAEH
jgi:molybdopterin-containing oxidoreductase family iron-sulfur binding subunit